VAFGATACPLHVSEFSEKSPEFAPDNVTALAENVKFAFPLLVTVTLSGAAVVPTFSDPKATLAGEKLTAGATVEGPKIPEANPPGTFGEIT
jgi:hypothetical protein